MKLVNFVKCGVCGSEIKEKSYPFHLYGAHKLKFKDYIKENPIEILRSEEVEEEPKKEKPKKETPKPIPQKKEESLNQTLEIRPKKVENKEEGIDVKQLKDAFKNETNDVSNFNSWIEDDQECMVINEWC